MAPATTRTRPLVKRTEAATIVAEEEEGADIVGLQEARVKVAEEALAGVAAGVVAGAGVEILPEGTRKFTPSTRPWWNWPICRSIFP